MKNFESLLITAFDSFREPMFILDSSRHCLLANQALLGFLKLNSDRSQSLVTLDFWPGVNQVNFSLPEIATEFTTSNGEVFAVKLSFSELPDDCLLIRLLAGVSRNETFLNFQAQRLETLGLLAGGVAHDFNNVLAGILGHITYLKTVLPSEGNHVESLIAIEEGARKASLITQQILNFSKMDLSTKPKRINLSDLLVKTCRLLRGAISPEYRIEYKIPQSPTYVLGVEGSLAQVIVNLVINARDALAVDGSIKLTLQEAQDQAQVNSAYRSQDPAAEHYCVLCVEDTGHGMPPDVLERIFEPYFSTKKDKGTGLGMATVLAIVRHFGGAIEVESKVGQGTSVRIFFPLVNEQPRELHVSDNESQEGAREVLCRGNESVLVVDDEFPVRNVLSVSLQHLGYQVEMASSGVEALEKYTQEGQSFDLVILDMLMPNLSGEKVFYKLRRINSHARVLFISGYSLAETVQDVLRHQGVGFIQKPFTIDELAKKVRHCLDLEFKE